MGREKAVTLQINDEAPDFEAETTEGRIRFHDWAGGSWVVLFSHPKDFTPVCTTELGYMAKIKPEFDRRDVKIIGLSVDPVDSHTKWASDIEETQGHAPNYPMIGDADFAVSKLYGMLPAETSGDAGRAHPGGQPDRAQRLRRRPGQEDQARARLPDDHRPELRRGPAGDRLAAADRHKVATPVNWKRGEDVIIAGSVSDEEARKTYPQGWEAPRPYIRVVPQPS